MATDLILPMGNEMESHASRGRTKIGKTFSLKAQLYRVSGEVVTFSEIAKRSGLSDEEVHKLITRERRKRRTMTWEVFSDKKENLPA